MTFVEASQAFDSTTPTEKEYYDSLSPDLKKKVDAFRAQLAEEEKRRDLAAQPEADKPVWAEGRKPAS
ncbi:hypothetical protein FRC04_011124 [Tulasnella sp. 424]|nr:hypothetical protein FRC04_011124 [Tulasnella sp. 424]